MRWSIWGRRRRAPHSFHPSLEPLEDRSVPSVTPGLLDPRFGGSGKVVRTDFPTAFGNAVALQPDGKTVVAGNYTLDPSLEILFVERYNADGTPDKSFSGGA